MLMDQYRKKSLLYRTNSLLVPLGLCALLKYFCRTSYLFLIILGDDFRYDKVKEWSDQYNNYIKLMNYLNSHSEFNVKVSANKFVFFNLTN